MQHLKTFPTATSCRVHIVWKFFYFKQALHYASEKLTTSWQSVIFRLYKINLPDMKSIKVSFEQNNFVSIGIIFLATSWKRCYKSFPLYTPFPPAAWLARCPWPKLQPGIYLLSVSELVLARRIAPKPNLWLMAPCKISQMWCTIRSIATATQKSTQSNPLEWESNNVSLKLQQVTHTFLAKIFISRFHFSSTWVEQKFLHNNPLEK
jgi:hypothetical protein